MQPGLLYAAARCEDVDADKQGGADKSRGSRRINVIKSVVSVEICEFSNSPTSPKKKEKCSCAMAQVMEGPLRCHFAVSEISQVQRLQQLTAALTKAPERTTIVGRR